jgi:enoyl-CoA hydratase/carnithine racemase
MPTFSEYGTSFRNVAMRREDGIIELTLHSDGGSLVWGKDPGTHADIANALRTVSEDADNQVVILTGAGDDFCAPAATPGSIPQGGPQRWEALRANAVRMMMSLLDMPGPVIGCINGPAFRHAQLPLLGDIVLAASHATVQDSAHFPNGVVPGDGVQLVFPLLLGWNRGRTFLLTGQTLTANDLRDLGLVSEVLPREALLPRAWEIARGLARQDPLLLRYTRMAITAVLRDLFHRHLEHGLALEGLAGLDRRPPGG